MVKKHNKYDWENLVAVGDSFVLTEAEHGAGYKFARQLVFAKNQTEIRNGSPSRFKCEKTSEGMKISRSA